MNKTKAEKKIRGARSVLKYIEKAVGSMLSLTVVIEEVDKLQKENEYLRNSFRELENEYSINPSTEAQKIHSRIKRIFYEVGANVEKGERSRGE